MSGHAPRAPGLRRRPGPPGPFGPGHGAGRARRWPSLRALATAWLALPVLASAQGPAPATPSSNLDAPLFYQLLIGEMEWRAGRAGSAYEIILDAARRQQDDQLYQRAVEIAVQARAGEQALEAARAWRHARPANTDALRAETQILLALDRRDDAATALTQWLARLPADEQAKLIAGLPRLLHRAATPTATPALVDKLTQPYMNAPATRGAALVARGRARLLAGDGAAALALAREAQADEPASPAPALLAMDLAARQPADAQALVQAYLARPDAQPMVRLAWARQLLQAQRHADARPQLERLTKDRPDDADAWLLLGALELELKHPAAAEAALQRHIALVQAATPTTLPPVASAPTDDADDDEDTPRSGPAGAARALTQAWLMMAQAAEQRGDMAAAEAWLARIDNPQRLLEVQTRRASILARQGRLDQARALLRATPERTGEDARAKWVAEAQLLREARQWPEAAEVLGLALRQQPDDTELMYELAMVEEKRLRFDNMEHLLRRVIELKPDHPHAHNALGYSLADRNTRLDEARRLVQQALALAPGDPFITDSLGWVAFRQGRLDEALQLLRQAYSARPDPEIAAHLGEVLWAGGQRDEARRIWREARARDADNEVLRDTLARLKAGL